MDQQLKERLVGATVLIVAGIVIIPLLLSGPRTSEPVRVGLELPAAEKDRQTHTIRLDVPASRPPGQAYGKIEQLSPQTVVTRREAAAGNGAAAGNEASVDPTPVPAASEPQPVPATKTVPRPETVAAQAATRTSPEPPDRSSDASSVTTGGWAVQIGSFSKPDNVDRISGQLRAAGFDTFSNQIVSGGRTLHRVRVGPVGDRAAAESLARQLESAGFAGRVVSNDP